MAKKPKEQTYICDVIETRFVQMRYTVVAASEAEAHDLASRGDTVKEDFVRELGVNAREVEDIAILEGSDS